MEKGASNDLRRLYPKHPLVGVGTVVQHEGRVLLIRRANEPGKGLWSIPGGLVELGETVREAAKREVEEETGIFVEIGELIDVIDNIIRDEKGAVKFHYVLVDFLAKPLSKEPIIRPSSEVLEADWFLPKELSKLSMTRTAQRLLQKLDLLPRL
ncbi:NUDIX hydrolase [Candidatus Bathyarchaeota archaeon]|nr:NUDIX hydrolase [Candidatus Bathyarchaeota archaeon]